MTGTRCLQKKGSHRMSFSVLLTTFCTLVLLWTFSFSAIFKGRRLSTFEQNIAGFALLPAVLLTPAALVLVGLEGSASLMLLLTLLWPAWRPLALGGFLLSTGLLFLFTIALLSVLARRLAVPCGCFGNTAQPVSWLDVGRTVGFLLCAVTGLLTFFVAPVAPSLPGLVTLVLAVMAAAFALIWAHLHTLLAVWRAPTA